MNIAFIPVRGGSKSIPLKNIKMLNGHPLVYWTTKAAVEAICIDKVVIATDSNQIKSTVNNFKLNKVEIFDRNSINAQDTSSTESVMLEYIERANLKDDDKLFLIQATSPLLKSEHIDGMWQKLISTNSESIFSGVIEKQFKWLRLKNSDIIKPVNYDYNNRPRRQDFEGLIAENGACYINSVKNIKKTKCRLSGKITFYALPSYMLYELDEEEDWIVVESLMHRYNY